MRRLLVSLAAAAVMVAMPVVTHAQNRPAPAHSPAVTTRVLTPSNDPFYRPPNPIPAVAPGTVLRWRTVTIPWEEVNAWQLMYRTTDTHGTAEAAVATVMVPARAPRGPRPLLAYQPAEDSLSTDCAPSYELRAGTETETAAFNLALGSGWTVVVPDFEGPESQFSAGVQEGHATLDAIRAAEKFPSAGIEGTATAVAMWGYSGGGHATAWAAELAPTYAPELAIAGVAYGSPAADLALTLHNLDGGPLEGLLLGGAVGIGRAYPELGLDSLLNTNGTAMEALVGRECGASWMLPYAFRHIGDYTTVPDPLSLPQVDRVLTADSLGQHRPAGPQYVYWGLFDEFNAISQGNALVARYCREGVSVDYHRIPLGDHLTVAVTEAPAAFAFLAARITTDTPAPDTCPPS